MFFCRNKLVFSGLLRLKGNFLGEQIIVKYDDQAHIMSFFVIDKPPDDPYKRKRYLEEKQKYSRFLRLYGNSLVGGIDQAKIITVSETEAKKKTGKKKQVKMVSCDKEPPFINN